MVNGLQAIDQEVWAPFRRAYAELDLAAFVAVHAADFVRETQCFFGPFDTVHRRTAAGWRLLVDRDDECVGDGPTEFGSARRA